MDSIHVTWKAFSGLECFLFSWVTFNRQGKISFWTEVRGTSGPQKNTWGRDCSGSYFAGMTPSIERQNHFQLALLIQSTSQKVSKPVRAVGPFGNPRVKLWATPWQYMRDKDGVFSLNFLPIIF